MTVPSGKGFRAIVVNGRSFKWRFVKRLIVVPDGLSGRQVLEVDLGWSDPWLEINDPKTTGSGRNPQIATPAFVAQAIAFALHAGWNAELRGGRFPVKYSTSTGFLLEESAQQATAE